MNNQGTGALGEYQAVEFLKKKGYKILSTNAVFAGCELDIVALYSVKAQRKAIKQEYKVAEVKSKTALKCRLSALEDILVFVEVKYNSTRVYGEPYERVTKEKQKHIIRASEAYIYKNRLQMPVRFDVISVVGKEINHIENAFYA